MIRLYGIIKKIVDNIFSMYLEVQKCFKRKKTVPVIMKQT